MNYKRYDSPYSVTSREADTITYTFNHQTWTLDYKNITRK